MKMSVMHLCNYFAEPSREAAPRKRRKRDEETRGPAQPDAGVDAVVDAGADPGADARCEPPCPSDCVSPHKAEIPGLKYTAGYMTHDNYNSGEA